MAPQSAIPDYYFYTFAFYEPLLCIGGFIGTMIDPKSTHDNQAPWPPGVLPPAELPLSSLVTVIQLAHVCALLGVVNFCVLRIVRSQLSSQRAIQEQIVAALFLPLFIGDIGHLYLTFWALGDARWHISNWSPMIWTNLILGLTLLVPRALWFMGVGRYIHARDGEGSRRVVSGHITQKSG